MHILHEQTSTSCNLSCKTYSTSAHLSENNRAGVVCGARASGERPLRERVSSSGLEGEVCPALRWEGTTFHCLLWPFPAVWTMCSTQTLRDPRDEAQGHRRPCEALWLGWAGTGTVCTAGLPGAGLVERGLATRCDSQTVTVGVADSVKGATSFQMGVPPQGPAAQQGSESDQRTAAMPEVGCWLGRARAHRQSTLVPVLPQRLWTLQAPGIHPPRWPPPGDKASPGTWGPPPLPS